MNFEKGMMAAGIVAGLTVSGCAGQETAPVAVMHVNCDRVPGDADILSLNALDTRAGVSEVEIDVTDQTERITLTVRLMGKTSINDTEIAADDAGKVLEKLPAAKLRAGVPVPNRKKDKYYAGDEGLTLVCNGASIADVRMNGSS